MSWPRARTFVGKLAPPEGPEPTPPTLTAALVSASGQRFRLTADGGVQINQATVIAEGTVTATKPGGPMDFAITNRTATSFEVNTQENGPLFNCGYTFAGIQTPDGQTFRLTTIVFVINAADAISFWIQITP